MGVAVAVIHAARALRVKRKQRATRNAPMRVHPQTKPTKLMPDVNTPVRSPRTGLRTLPGVRGLRVEEVAVLEVRIGVATRTRGAGGG